jgi:predicted nucleic acid-binding protein
MRTLSAVEALEPLPVDDAAARAFSEIVADSRRRGRRPWILDALIAATAVSRAIPVYTQDADFDDMAGVEVVRV